MSSLFLALVLYPEVQKRAQAELDSVISRDRLPTYDDRPRLPYIEAMSKELLRWHMVTPMGAGCPANTPNISPTKYLLKASPTPHPTTMSIEDTLFQKVPYFESLDPKSLI